VLPYTLVLPPLILALVLRPLSFGKINYLPAGPTPLLFAILAQFHAAIPSTYRYKVGATATPPSPPSASSSATAQFFALRNGTLTFTSKTMSYLLPVQLALSQFPSSILPAVVGWAVGYAYRNEVLPATSWRLPAWMVGQKSRGPNLESLRRRMEGEDADRGYTSGRQSTEADREQGAQPPRGRLAQLFGEQFYGRREG
jgi:hypothetical protein